MQYHISLIKQNIKGDKGVADYYADLLAFLKTQYFWPLKFQTAEATVAKPKAINLSTCA